MKICAFSSYTIDKPASGAEVRVFEMLHHLVRFGNEVRLFVPGVKARRYVRTGIEVTVVPYPRVVRTVGLNRPVITLVRKLKATVGYSSLLGANPNVLRYAKDTIRASNVVLFIDRFQIFPLIYARTHGKVCVMDLLGFFFSYFISNFRSLVASPIGIAKLAPVILAESLMMKLADYTVVSSSEDKTNCVNVLGLNPNQVFLIPDGIDPDDFSPSIDDGQTTRRSLGIDEQCLVIAFVGNMTGPHNYSAVKFIMEGLAQSLASRLSSSGLVVRFLIVGAYDYLPEEWLRNSSAIFTGYVDKVGRYLNAADICISPLTSGTGMKTKTLGYLACGRAVVTTPIGAEGLDLVNGRDAFICNLESMEDRVFRLVLDEHLRQLLGTRAREKFSTCTWEQRARSLHEILLKMALKSNASGRGHD